MDSQALAHPQATWAGLPLASWGVRLGAWTIDALVLLIPAFTLFAVIVVGVGGIFENDGSLGAAIDSLIIYFLLMGAMVLLYAPLLMVRAGKRNGQTWGKQLFNIRVVRDSAQPFGFGSAVVREVGLKILAVNVAAGIIPLIPWVLNYCWPLWDDQNRCLHDMVVSTHVVRA